MTTTTLTVASSELREGDVVLAHDMKVRIGKPQQSQSHAVGEYGPVFWARGTVENYDDLGEWMRGYLRAVNAPDRPLDSWTIQGNDLVRWHVWREV